MIPTAEAEHELESWLGPGWLDSDSHYSLADQSDSTFLKRQGAIEISADAPTVRVADLFCGCGGLSLGAREACSQLDRRFVAVWAVDSDPRALKVYRRNFYPIYNSSRPLEGWLPGNPGEPPKHPEKKLQCLIGELDFLLAGPPCQGHSALNNRTRHKDERNRLYSKVGRFVEILEPQHVLIENVPAVVLDKDQSIHRTADHLHNLGYFIDACVVDLSKLGVPQRRKRHILVASRLRQPDLSNWLSASKSGVHTVRWAIGDLEHAGENGLMNAASALSEANRRRVDYLFEHGIYDLPNTERPRCHQNGNHSYKSMYGRLAWDEPAQTITTGFNSPGQGRFVHPSRRRTLTAREAARLQFFPDDFDFSDVRHRSILARMIGNAVPPKLSWIICRELLR